MHFHWFASVFRHHHHLNRHRHRCHHHHHHHHHCLFVVSTSSWFLYVSEYINEHALLVHRCITIEAKYHRIVLVEALHQMNVFFISIIFNWCDQIMRYTVLLAAKCFGSHSHLSIASLLRWFFPNNLICKYSPLISSFSPQKLLARWRNTHAVMPR